MIVVMIVMWTCHVDVVHTRILQANLVDISNICSSVRSVVFTMD